ncbi:mitochondrial carrier [Sarocladium strictum]
MTESTRIEDEGVHTEDSPLLVNDTVSHIYGTGGEPPPESAQRVSSWYIWRLSGFLALVFVLTLFVKGWVDADEDFKFDLSDALKKAVGGGLSGAAAMVLQVLLLMPLRTIMNYQYRFGTSFTEATSTLYAQGGCGRYYQGITAALIQGPAARFGDTAANAGILALLQSNPYLAVLPSLAKTVFASLCAALFRMVLTPLDTVKTTLQAQGSHGTVILRQRIRTHGLGTLWWGALATAAATFVGHYPWFATYNLLSELLQEPTKKHLGLWLARLAFIGFAASVVSDTVSNSLRVVKTFRQVSLEKVSYSEAALLIVREDGVVGLLGRGLKARILANGLQGLLFSILWKLFQDFQEADFNALYLQRTTQELAEDLDKVRNAEDFKADSVPFLVHALQQGAKQFTPKEQQRVVAASKDGRST